MTTLEDRNKAVVLRLKDEISSKGRFDLAHEIMVPGFRPRRQAIFHLAQNARDQGHPEPGQQMRKAIPDRVDEIESIVAEGDRVGMLWRVTGTHQGNLFGIPPTGRKIDIYSLGIFRVEHGLIADAFFMADEVGLLQQLGVGPPRRKDGAVIAPSPTREGEDAAVVLARLRAQPAATREHVNKIAAVRSKAETDPAVLGALLAPDHHHRRWGMQHMNDYGKANGVGHLNPAVAFPDRRDRIEGLIAEGNTVWMPFRLAGTHAGSFFGHPPTGNSVEIAEVAIMKFADGRRTESWFFGDELGLLLQMNAVHLLFPGNGPQ